MADLDADYRKILDQTFAARKARNPRYSLRSFARTLKVDSGFLSRLLRGKILLSLDIADRMTKLLKLSEEARAAFLKSAAEEQTCHSLYLIHPALTECDPSKDETNRSPTQKTERTS